MSQESGSHESAPPRAARAEPSDSGASTELSESAPQPALLSDGELDAIEDELARAERTLGLLADDDIDPAAATAWLSC